jgi:hypothetical protein
MLQEIRRLTEFANLHEKEFLSMVAEFSQQAEVSETKRKERELNKLTARNKELDRLFERMYEDNVSGKVTDERYYKMTANYEAEQGENNKRVKILRTELQKEQGQQYAADSFINVVRKYTNPTELTQLMLAELIEKIEVYHAEKIDGMTVQRLNIYYNFVGVIELPEFMEPIDEIIVNTRQGVNVAYTPSVSSAV